MTDRKEVLFINSYHQGQEWSDPITRAIEDRMADSGFDVNLHIEYLDEKRYGDPTYEEMLVNLYRYKYGGQKFDVIITSDDAAFTFIKKYRADLFPGTPVVFSGLNYFSPDMLAGQDNITGVVEQYDVKDTLSTALVLQPALRHVYIINDVSDTGIANKRTIEEIIPGFEPRLDFVFLENYSMPELQETVSSLPANSMILLMTFNKDRTGVVYSYDESIRLIHEQSNAPMYGIWEMYLGKGIVGGILTSGYEQGNISARMATMIMQGSVPANYPVVNSPPNRAMFDSGELSRFNIDISRLPAGSTVINRSSGLRGLSDTVVWAILISASGLILGMGAMGVAVVRLRRARDDLDQSERRYRAVVEDQEELICRFRPDRTCVFVNDAYCRFFRKTRSEILGSKFIPSMTREEKEKISLHLASLTPVHPIASMTNRLVLPDQTVCWLKWNNRAIFDENGNGIEYQSVGRDVTDVKLAEEELKKYHENLENLIETRTKELINSNAKLQQEVAERTLAEDMLGEEKERLAVTLRSIGEGVITTDTNGRVLLLNKVAEQLTGWKQEFALMKPIHEILHMVEEKERRVVEDPTAGVIRNDGTPDFPHRAILVARDGSERFIDESASVIKDHENKTIGVVIVFRDITERQKMETELSRTQKLESLGLLAGGIAHDFNNILTAIFGNIILAKMNEDKESPSYERLIEAENALVRAKELTQQLLTFSKGGAPVKETADIAGIIVDSTKFMLRGSQSRSEFEIMPDLWPVEVDVGQISQVINNIVINADHAMPSGGIIRVSAENCTIPIGAPLPLTPGRYVKIIVSDQGVGISKENLARIFDPYFTTKQKGSGLGLSTALSIIKKHSGYIEIESGQGTGTSVHVFLPASDRTIAIPKGKEEGLIEGEGRILIMDDEEAILDMASALLNHFGYRVEVATNGEEALERFRKAKEEQDPFDVVIMDLTIPGGMGGKETMEKLREIDPGVRAIVSSGYSTDPIIAHFREFGFSGILTKPYTAKEMSNALKSVFCKGKSSDP